MPKLTAGLMYRMCQWLLLLHHCKAAMAPAACLQLRETAARAEETASAEVQQLVASLRQQHPDMLSQLESFMTEMDRITVLPEELWHSALQSLQVRPAMSMLELNSRLCPWTGSREPFQVLAAFCLVQRHAGKVLASGCCMQAFSLLQLPCASAGSSCKSFPGCDCTLTIVITGGCSPAGCSAA